MEYLKTFGWGLLVVTAIFICGVVIIGLIVGIIKLVTGFVAGPQLALIGIILIAVCMIYKIGKDVREFMK
jgi:hypothetical protein